jgi:hypothetical protein
VGWAYARERCSNGKPGHVIVMRLVLLAMRAAILLDFTAMRRKVSIPWAGQGRSREAPPDAPK